MKGTDGGFMASLGAGAPTWQAADGPAVRASVLSGPG
jgi:hypothetical protein